MKRLYFFTVMLMLWLSLGCYAQPALIPVPKQVAWGNGTFQLTRNATIGCANAQLRPAADYLRELLGRPTGYSLKPAKARGTIQLSLTGEGAEGFYKLRVEKTGIHIEGHGYKGVVNGIATLRQLFSDDIESARPLKGHRWSVPLATITDEPRFSWRGMELDCSRHFFTKAEVMKLLDVLALYKIDRLHWHLTDDQGWRIEIKRYPKLTANGAWRTFNNQDSTCMARARKEDNADLQLQSSKVRTDANGRQVYGGFYTQDDVRQIVAYAKKRGIEIIPEIDMPGHSLMAISNYSGLSCFPQHGWGRDFSSPMCPGKDSMLEFCKNVWSELFDLFPSRFVHIGGDEVDMTNWKKCPDCRKRMKDHGLTTEPQLQSWFLHYMENFFNAHGRHMIGWDEIISGGLSATSTVMWWRSWSPDAPKQTTSHGNRLICTPNAQFYLDYQEDANSIANIYAFDPFKGLNAEERKLVLGVQGNLWTEWVPSVDRMWYQAFPRMLAIAELGWSEPERAQLADFRLRLASHFSRLRKMGVRYRIPDLTGFHSVNVFTDKAEVKVECADASALIRYTTDGSLPQLTSASYTRPFTIDHSADFTFRTFSPDGHKGDVYRFRYVREDYAPAAPATPDSNGLEAKWFDYRGANCAGISAAPFKGTYVVDAPAIPSEVSGNIGLIITGYVYVPQTAVYTFSLLSDDGSNLYVDGKRVVDNDGEHSPRELAGQHAMSKGWHPIKVEYFDHNGGCLSLKITDAEGRPVQVNFKH